MRDVAVVNPLIVPADEDLRLAALRHLEILDTPPDGAFDRITALAARLFNVPIAIVSLVDHDRIWFKSHHGLDIDQIPRDAGLCASAILHETPWVVNDARHDPRALANPLVAGEFGLQFYAGIPLRTGEGYNLGTLCVLDFQPRELSETETSMLQELAALVIGEMELRLATRRAARQAREREELNDAFVAMLSHELRTPVTTIYAAAQILARDPAIQASERAQELFPDVITEADRLVRLIDDLLVLTKVERGALEPTGEPVLLQRLLPEVISRQLRRASERSIELHVEADVAPVAGDTVFIEQVVANLLSNALKYSAAGTTVDVSLRGVEGGAEVRVRDHGIGLGDEDRESVFGLLVRTDAAARQAAGAGIGLYVCRRLLEAMGGQIWVETPQGGGTAFAFRMPTAS
ncbi:MAG: hypothetical protein QOH61_1045, partial [Chloroflexota bacterium]|nr:hypothetical protein [Chloroflexota bacterium]